MSKRQWLMLFGVWVMVFPFLGFPSEWNKIIALVSGFLILIGAYRLGSISMDEKDERQVPYIEHRSTPPQVSDIDMRKDFTNADSSQS